MGSWKIKYREKCETKTVIGPNAKRPLELDIPIYVGGKIAGLGVDAVEGEITELDVRWLERKLAIYGLEAPNGARNMTKIVSGKKLWNYDNLEPTEKKLVL